MRLMSRRRRCSSKTHVSILQPRMQQPPSCQLQYRPGRVRSFARVIPSSASTTAGPHGSPLCPGWPIRRINACVGTARKRNGWTLERSRLGLGLGLGLGLLHLPLLADLGSPGLATDVRGKIHVGSSVSMAKPIMYICTCARLMLLERTLGRTTQRIASPSFNLSDQPRQQA